eukprot:SAG11_NODE_25148_length_363_cov_0.780303_1_plen_23_part_10
MRHQLISLSGYFYNARQTQAIGI